VTNDLILFYFDLLCNEHSSSKPGEDFKFIGKEPCSIRVKGEDSLLRAKELSFIG
jgi:hypothetical protein